MSERKLFTSESVKADVEKHTLINESLIARLKEGV